MATVALVDIRKNVPKTAGVNSFWVTSNQILGSACEDKGVILFAFPKGDLIPATRSLPNGRLSAAAAAAGFGEIYVVEQAIAQVTTLFNGTTPTITVGVGTIATPATTSGNITYADAAGIIPAASITAGTAGLYGGKFDGSSAAIVHYKTIITCADTSTPVIFAHVESGDTDMTAGAAVVHVKLTRLGDSI
jgi:hypothetical protein